MFKLHKSFTDGETSTTDATRSGRPKLTDYSKIKNIAALVGNSGRWTIDEIAIVQD